MRIAVNTRLLLHGKMDGIGWFSYETMRRIVLANPNHEFLFFFDRKPSPEFIFADNVKPIVLHPQARHPILWYIFFEWSVKQALKKHHCDLFLSPDGWMPLIPKTPTLIVIHDLNFEHSNDYLRKSHQLYMKYFFPRFAHNATRVATVSQYSKQDICSTYGISKNKIDVVYDGAHEGYRQMGEAINSTTRAQYTNGAPYIIFVSTILKRKNLANLLLAFDKFKNQSQQPHKLVVVGRKVWWKEELADAYNKMTHAEEVLFVDHAEPSELTRLMSAATALVYPSFFEGFGIPIIEAFNAGVPVITSNITSMPEVAGNAALLVDPYSADDIASAISIVVSDEQVRNELIKNGHLRSNLFNWDKTANLLWESITKTLVP